MTRLFKAFYNIELVY